MLNVLFKPEHSSAAALLYTEWHTISKAAHILEGLSYFKVFAKGRLQLLLINTIVLKSPCFEFPYNRERTWHPHGLHFFILSHVYVERLHESSLQEASSIDYRILQRSFLPLAPSDVHTILLNQFSLMCGTHTRQLSHFSIIAFTFR